MKQLKASKKGPSDQRLWRPVSSSFIREIKHENGRVKVNINGKIYEYADRSGDKYQALIRASSKGRVFNRLLRSNRFRRSRRR